MSAALVRRAYPADRVTSFSDWNGSAGRWPATSASSGRSRGCRPAAGTTRSIHPAWRAIGRSTPCVDGVDPHPACMDVDGMKGRSRPISRVLSWTVIPLGATSPQRSSNLPGSNAGRANGSLFGLAPGGVCRTGLLPDSRCALTAPFHPYRPSEEDVGGIFLLHFPSACAAQALPGTLPYGARTFLGTPEGMTRLSGRLRRAHSSVRGPALPV